MEKNLQYHQTRQIEITVHAKMRLRERVKNFDGYRNWEHLVKTARYCGKTLSNMTDEEYRWCCRNLSHIGQSCQIRVLNGFAYVFKGNKGHARTLVTVISMFKQNQEF